MNCPSYNPCVMEGNKFAVAGLKFSGMTVPIQIEETDQPDRRLAAGGSDTDVHVSWASSQLSDASLNIGTLLCHMVLTQWYSSMVPW